MTLSNGRVALIVGLVVFVLLFIATGAGTAAPSGFEAGRRVGYVFGQAVIVGLIVWAVLKYGLRRRA